MSKLGEDGEHINVKEFSLELLEEQNIEEEPRTMFLSAGVAFILFGAILWTVLGTQSVDKIVEAYKFQKSSCQVVPSEALVKNLSCQCEGRSVCQSMYPCVRINVVLKNQKTSLNGSVVRTILYNSIYEVHSECSIGPPCKRNYEHNLQAVKSFTNLFRNNSNNITCYYNPADQQQVILSREGHVGDLFHSLFWPFLFVGFGLFMFYKFLKSK